MLTPFALRCQIKAGYPRPMLATIEEWRSLSKASQCCAQTLSTMPSSMQPQPQSVVRAKRSLRTPSSLSRHTGSRASGIVMQWTLPPPGGEEIELRIQDLDPLRAQRRVDPRAVARRNDTVAAERQEIARHRHHFAIGRLDHADSARFQPVGEIVAQNLDAGHRKPGRRHAEEDVEVKEMLGEGLELRLPALVREPAGELRRALPRGADSRPADEKQSGPDDVDVAALDRAVAAIAPEAAVASMKAQDGGDLAAARGKRELGQRRSPGRGLARIARIDLIGQMRLGLDVMAPDSRLIERVLELAELALQALRVDPAPRGQRLDGDRVGLDPLVMIGPAEQHVGQHARFGID